MRPRWIARTVLVFGALGLWLAFSLGARWSGAALDGRSPRIPTDRDAGPAVPALSEPALVDRSDWLVELDAREAAGRSETQPPLVYGFVREPDGAPVTGAEVRPGEASATTNVTGRFELRLLSPAYPGFHRLALTSDGR